MAKRKRPRVMTARGRLPFRRLLLVGLLDPDRRPVARDDHDVAGLVVGRDLHVPDAAYGDVGVAHRAAPAQTRRAGWTRRDRDGAQILVHLGDAAAHLV